MEVINDLVGYKNLKIYQNDDWFRFSLESILLPSFVSINPRFKKILDLCSGNAPIPIVLSTRTKAFIVGVEIQKDVYELAQKSININHLEKQVRLICDDLKNLKNYYDSDTFDLITVNPPYFKNDELSVKNIDIHKKIARHEVYTNLEEILQMSFFLLKNNGYFAMVHRSERLFEIIDELEKYHLTPKRIQLIYPKVGKESNLFMVECIKNGKKGVKIESPLYIHTKDGKYRKKIKNMFQL